MPKFLDVTDKALARDAIGFREAVKDLRTHIDLRDWDAVSAANWNTFGGAVITFGSPVVTNAQFTADDVGKVAMLALVDSEWWMTTVESVDGNTATMTTNAPASRTGVTVRYGFDGTTAINAALQEIDANTDGPAEVYLGGNYRLTQLVIPGGIKLRGVPWAQTKVQNLASLSRTSLAQLPGAECNFVVFEENPQVVGWLASSGFSDFELWGPEKKVSGMSAGTVGNGVAFCKPDGTPLKPADGFEMRNVQSMNFPESGFRCYGAVPFYVDNCKALYNGKYGFEHARDAGNSTNALTLTNFSADWNDLGAIYLGNLRPFDTVFLNGVKSEGSYSGDDPNGIFYAGPNYQSNCLVIENCDRTAIMINGMSHIRVGRAGTAPGPAITIKSGSSLRPRLSFNTVMCQLLGTEAGSTADAVTLRDEISSVDIPVAVKSGFYPSMSAPVSITGNNGNALLKFSDTASATAYPRIYNNLAGLPPIIAVEDPGAINTGLALQPKGNAAVQILGDAPTVIGGASGDTDLDLKSRGTGTVKINGAAALYSGGALGTPASGTLTNCTGLPVSGISGSTGTALGVGSIELGHASDTTITRSAAGVVAVEGVDLVSTSRSQTITNKIFIPASSSTVTSAGTLTLTSASSSIQIFTGTSSHTVVLPSTGIVAGQTYTVINNSSSYVLVSGITTINNGKMGIFTAKIDTPTSADWYIETPDQTAQILTLAQRDANGNLTTDAFISSVTSTATAASTTTMNLNSTQTQVFTGSTTQTVKLPTTSVVAGQQYTIVNQSTGDVTVQSSAGNTVATMTGAATPTAKLFIALQATPTSDTHWRAI